MRVFVLFFAAEQRADKIPAKVEQRADKIPAKIFTPNTHLHIRTNECKMEIK